MTALNLPKLIDQGPLLQSSGLVHRVLKPSGKGPHPTLVMLHGRTGNEDVMWLFEHVSPGDWLKITPRGIVADPRGGYSWLQQEYGTWPSLEAFETAVTALQGFLQALPAQYNADPQRMYLMGFSQGAATSYATALHHPALVQAIAGLVGFMPGDCKRPSFHKALRELPIFMAVGTNDPLIPREQSSECALTLRQAGAQLTYREYNTGHKLNSQGFQDLRAWWLDR
jgi:phospholipase/carboxylesterase